jgi:hypothetical protein
MEAEYTALLKREVEKKFGRKILSSADCHSLSNEIMQWSQIKISFNTLRRFFNLMKADHQPSMYTLNALSGFCGYSSFDNFITSRSNLNLNGEPEEASGLLNYLVLLFKNTEVSNVNDVTYFSLVQQTIYYLEQHAYLIERFQKEIAGTQNGQRFYFELFINIDKLNSFYGDGLRYYLHEKRDAEAQLFAHSLLCFKSWLVRDDEAVRQHYAILLRYEVTKLMQPSVCARYFASQLFYADVMGLDKEPILDRARQFYASIVPLKDHYASFYCFEIILSEAIMLTGQQYEEATYYIDALFIKLKRYVPSYINVALLETVCLFRAIVFAHTGRKQKAIEILCDIVPIKFCFLSKQYLNILYLQLKSALRNKNVEQEQTRYLIQQTGFIRLASLWKNTCSVSIEENR